MDGKTELAAGAPKAAQDVPQLSATGGSLGVDLVSFRATLQTSEEKDVYI